MIGQIMDKDMAAPDSILKSVGRRGSGSAANIIT